MAYKLNIHFKKGDLDFLKDAGIKVQQIIDPLVGDALDLVQEYAKEHLSGIPFTHDGESHTIQKRSGKGAASVQTQYPYGGPYRGRIYASAYSTYPGHDPVDYLSVLEYGRGEIRPKSTPSMVNGQPGKARLTVPAAGGTFLAHGASGFRGASGNYRFVSRIPPMKGKGWMAAAADKALPEIQEMASKRVGEALDGLS